VTTIIRTKRELRISAVAAVLAGSAAFQPAGAQEQAVPVSVDVSECVKLTTPEERLACFESQVQAARGSPTVPVATPPASTAAPPGSGSRDARSDDARGEEARPPDIRAAVAGLRETVPNAYLITLDNGEVWRQTVPKTYPLRHGDAVRIYYSRWGTYRLTNEQLKSFIQVERVR
jgi:hypothetical protein